MITQTEKEFLKLMEENQRIVHKISRLYRDSAEDRRDLFQEIVFQLWKAYPSFRGEAKVSSWMYRIALNTALATFRKNNVKISYRDTLPDLADDSGEVSGQEEQMYKALKKLSESERAIIALFLEDYSYQEIAQITGITENYVGVKISRIKEKLKTIINP
jgi:RNA polymerase sigma factor (sigma-70 family)